MICPIPLNGLHSVWNVCAPLLAKGLWRAHGRFDLVDIYDDLIHARASLWVDIEGAEVRAAAVIKINQYPKKKYLHITLVGGHSMDEWGSEMIDELEKYARYMGCDGIEGCGRPGWTKAGNSYGFIVTGVAVEKSFNA